MYVSTLDLVVDNDEDGDIARCGRARCRVMPFGTARLSGIDNRYYSGLWSYQAMLRFVTCMDGSFDVILSTMVVAVSEGEIIPSMIHKRWHRRDQSESILAATAIIT